MSDYSAAQALCRYVKDPSPTVNRELRENSGCADPSNLFDDLFDSEKVFIDNDQCLYRKIGLQYYELGLNKDGSQYLDYAYLSTSTDITDVLSRYDPSPSIVLLIINHMGLPVIDVNKTLQKYYPDISFNDENEYILPRNTVFSIGLITDYSKKEFDRLVIDYKIDERPDALIDIYKIEMVQVVHLSPK